MVTIHNEVLKITKDIRTLLIELLETPCSKINPSSSYSPPSSGAPSPHNPPPVNQQRHILNPCYSVDSASRLKAKERARLPLPIQDPSTNCRSERDRRGSKDCEEH